MAENEINKVQVLIRRFLFEVDGVIHDPSACQAWLQSFCKTLQFQDLCKEPNQYALFLLAEARAFNLEQRRKSQMKQVRRTLAEDGIKNPTQEQLDEKWLEMYGQEIPQDAPNGNAGVDVSDAGNGAASKSPTSCDIYEQAGNPPTRESETRGPQTDNNSEAVKALADGDIREDSQAEPDGSAITRNETRAHDALGPSASIYATRQAKNGDAATREGAEVIHNRESGVAAPITVSRNMRRVPQNEAPAHGFSGGRTAQGTMSRPPEAAAQSGKAYDQETDEISTDGPRQAEARESRRAGGNSLRVAKVSTSPARSAGPMPEDKQAVYDFAAAEGLDTADAYECWNVTVNERDGRTADGKRITNWKAYVRKWCATRAKRRSA